jgi:hypothetical protein
VWVSNFRGPYAVRALLTVRDKAPFGRWRSLQLWFHGRNSLAESRLATLVAFPNLESLLISITTDIALAGILCRAAMPKLQMLDLRSGGDVQWEDSVIKLLNGGELSLPDPIITLHAGIRERHPFPKILNYKLDECVFRIGAPINLRSMTSFTIDGCLSVYQECDVLLPALQYLRLMNINILSGGQVKAPVLRTLHLFVPPNRKSTRNANVVPEYMRHAAESPGYHLSPKRLIIQDPYLSKEAIIQLLNKSWELTQATICFNDQESAQEVVRALYECGVGNNPLHNHMCPRLEELMLDCQWHADVPLSAERWLSGLEDRKEDPRRRSVSIKVRRRGEDQYQLLGES